MKVELSEELKEYLQLKKMRSILLEYMAPSSLCNGSVGHLVAHLVKIRDRNKVKDIFTSILVEEWEILVPNEMMRKTVIRLDFKRALMVGKGSIRVTFRD